MGDDADNGLLLLDAYGFRVLGFMTLRVRDGTALLARFFATCAPEIAVSPEVASWMTGLSAKALRGAIRRGELPAIGSGSHKYIRLPVLVRRGLNVERGVVCALDDLHENSTHDEVFVAGGASLDDQPAELVPMLDARAAQLAEGL